MSACNHRCNCVFNNACDGRACACAGNAFEKAHALMKRICITCNGKYTENCWAEISRWLTLTRIPGSVWPIVSLGLAFYNREKPIQRVTYLCYSVGTSDVEVRQYLLAFSRHNF